MGVVDRFPVHATVAASDLERAKSWYREKLELAPEIDEPTGAWYRFAGDTWLLVYHTPSAGTAQNTQAGWAVSDIESVVEDLRTRGVAFEDYDFGEMKTVNGVLETPAGKSAWFKDSEGNIFELSERAE